MVCSKMWTDVTLKLANRSLTTCCKRFPPVVPSLNEIEKLGPNLFQNHPQFAAEKLHFLNTNSLPAACGYCGDAGANSMWSVWNKWRDVDWSQEQLAKLAQEDHTSQIEIMLGSSCNQTCMYCNEGASSAWAQIKGLPVERENEEWSREVLKNLYSYVQKSESRPLSYSFVGGEPLLEPRLFPLIEKLISFHREHPNSKIKEIRIITNLNVSERIVNQLLGLIMQFPEIKWKISASLDATGKFGEEIRDGLDWSRFEQNFERLFATHIFLELIPSINCLSITEHAGLLEWLKIKAKAAGKKMDFGKSWHIASNTVTDPVALHPGLLPQNFSSHIDKAIQVLETFPVGTAHEVHAIHLNNVRSMLGTKRSHAERERAREWYSQQGQLKGKDYFSIFPILNQVL